MIIVNYHEISARRVHRRYVTPRKLFAAQIDALIELGFSFVTLSELVRSPLEERPRLCAITFDDGRLGAHEHGARVLRERGIKATYFLSPDWLDAPPRARAEAYSEFMTWDHAAELAAEGNTIGSHGKSHLPFFAIGAESATREVVESKRRLEERLHVPCEHFASPWGQIDRNVMSLVRDSGYETLSSTVPGPNKIPYERFRLRRLDASAHRSLRRFLREVHDSVDAHRRFDVALVRLNGKWERNAAREQELAGFDLALCLDDASYELCLELGLPCLRPPTDAAGDVEPHDLLRDAYGATASDRDTTFTHLTVGEIHTGWTYLSSFLPGTSRTRSDTRSRISTRP